MTEHEINIDERWFNLIKHKFKKVEGRLNKGVFNKFKKGDTIIFVTKKGDKEEKLKTKIVRITEYDTFTDYLINEGLRHTLPGIKTLDEGLAVYYKYYTKEQEKEFKILAIKIKILE